MTIGYSGSAGAGSVDMLSSYGFVPTSDSDDGALWEDEAVMTQAVAEGHVWSTSIADDEALLAAGAVTPAMAQAVRLRLALKCAAAKAVPLAQAAAANSPAP